ncbi:MAG: 3-keto-disaccharide hydrolase [Opitutaceae bacterium]
MFASATARTPAAEPGFIKLDNGRDLAGWSGDPRYWSVQDGAITGKSTAGNPVEANTFLIWQGGKPAGFELRAQFRLTTEQGNSGIQYRSRVLDGDRWVVGGYQADMDAANRYTGMLYEEKGRGIVVRPGERIRIGPLDDAGKPTLSAAGPAGDAAAIKAAIHTGDWNEIVIIAEGNHLRHYVNGRLTAEAFDDDETKAAKSGVLALQLHTGPPMTIQFKDIRLKRLP